MTAPPAAPGAAGGSPHADAPGPGSPTWRILGDVRGLLLAPATLVLQVAHPVVGAGVAEHSTFLADPWGRLVRTIASTVRFTYGDDAAAGAEADRLRALHRPIAGTDGRGRRYSALDPDAYAWVHLTLARFGVDTRRVLGRALSSRETEAFYAEWRQVGLRLGVRDDRMPGDWRGFERYFDATVAGVLEVNQAVRDVIAVTARPPAPAAWIPPGWWHPLADPVGRGQVRLAAGTLPPELRERIGLAWDAGEERRMWRTARAVRLAMAAVPLPLRYYPNVAPYALRAWARRLRA